MKIEDQFGADAGQFHTTQWDVILLSAQSEALGGEAALAELCRQYWRPLYAFLRRFGYGREDAEDLIQGFFQQLLTHRALEKVDPVKGRFRCFLLASLQNYLSNEASRARCQKRGGKVSFVSLDTDDVEDGYDSPLAPGTIFDARWAMALLDQALDRLSESYATQGRSATFKALKLFLDPFNNQELPPYEQVAMQVQVSAKRVGVLIHRLRKQYTALLREEVRKTVSDPSDVDDEIHALCSALVTAAGRLDS